MDEIDGQVVELQKEVARLKDVNRELRSEKTKKGFSPVRWRYWLAIVLLVLGCVLVPFSVTAVWLNRQIVDADAYVNTVVPLSKDPAIQRAVASYATDQLFSNTDAENTVRDSLPPKAQFLSGPLTDGLRNFTVKAAQKVLGTPLFSTIWESSNRIAHKLIVKTFISGTSATTSGNIQLDLGPALTSIKTQLQQSGIHVFDRISPDKLDGKFTIFKSQALATVRSTIGLINSLAIVIPLMAILFLGAAVTISPDRRKNIFRIGLGLAIVITLFLVGIRIGRIYYLNSLAVSVPRDAAAAFFDIISLNLRIASRGIFLLAIVLMLGSYVAGPSPSSIKLRQALKRGLGEFGAEIDFGPAGAWIAVHKSTLRVLGAVAALGVLVIFEQMTPLAVSLDALLLLAYLAAIEVFGRETKKSDRKPRVISEQKEDQRKAG